MKHLSDATERQRLLQRVAGLTPDTPRHWGGMTAHQMVCHLTDSYRAGMGEKTVSPAPSVLPRALIKWIALRVPIQWPKGVRTRPEVEQGMGGTPPGDFERDRATLVSVIERFSDPHRNFQWQPHPMFGDMREEEWMRWGYLHADHHLRQFGA